MKNILKITAGTFIAILLLVGHAKASEIKTSASSHEAIEITLQLENWMTDETIWNTNSLEFVVETETSLELENWMTNSESWNLNNIFVNEAELALELEDWMSNDATWNAVNNDIETELTIEPWMIDNNIWE
jgi:hypothetical protein